MGKWQQCESVFCHSELFGTPVVQLCGECTCAQKRLWEHCLSGHFCSELSAGVLGMHWSKCCWFKPVLPSLWSGICPAVRLCVGTALHVVAVEAEFMCACWLHYCVLLPQKYSNACNFCNALTFWVLPITFEWHKWRQ